MSKPKFKDWTENPRTQGYFRELRDGSRALVEMFDGWNWGYLILAKSGSVLAGRCQSELDVWGAVEHANAAIHTLQLSQ